MGLIAWIVFGLIVGAIAKLLMPGKDPGGCLITIAIGVVGSILGGYLGTAIGLYEPGVNGAGIIMSIIGAMLLLALYRLVAKPERD